MNKPVVSRFDATSMASLRNYMLAFGGSLVLTLLAFDAVLGHWFGRRLTLGFVGVLAVLQAVWQLQRFLHLGHEAKPRWKLAVLTLMVGIIIIVVAGSLWIMSSLNYRMMLSPMQQNQYLQSQDGL